MLKNFQSLKAKIIKRKKYCPVERARGDSCNQQVSNISYWGSVDARSCWFTKQRKRLMFTSGCPLTLLFVTCCVGSFPTKRKTPVCRIVHLLVCWHVGAARCVRLEIKEALVVPRHTCGSGPRVSCVCCVAVNVFADSPREQIARNTTEIPWIKNETYLVRVRLSYYNDPSFAVLFLGKHYVNSRPWN